MDTENTDFTDKIAIDCEQNMQDNINSAPKIIEDSFTSQTVTKAAAKTYEDKKRIKKPATKNKNTSVTKTATKITKGILISFLKFQK